MLLGDRPGGPRFDAEHREPCRQRAAAEPLLMVQALGRPGRGTPQCLALPASRRIPAGAAARLEPRPAGAAARLLPETQTSARGLEPRVVVVARPRSGSKWLEVGQGALTSSSKSGRPRAVVVAAARFAALARSQAPRGLDALISPQASRVKALSLDSSCPSRRLGGWDRLSARPTPDPPSPAGIAGDFAVIARALSSPLSSYVQPVFGMAVHRQSMS